MRLDLPDVVEHEQRYLAKAMASFVPDPEHPEQIGFIRFETLEVSKIRGEWWQAKKDTGEECLAVRHYRGLYGDLIGTIWVLIGCAFA